MTYFGHVKNGVVVLDDPAVLTEGSKVQVTVAEPAEGATPEKPFWETILDLAAAVPAEEWDKLPVDGAVNHDHYLYGCRKKVE